MDPDVELEGFKTQIDLRQYAASVGYVLDERKSGRNASVMRLNDDKINIRRLGDGHYVYYSFRDNRSGSIIDFIQHRKALNLGEVRKELRPWIGVAPSAFPKLESVARDFQTVSARLAQMTRVSSHAYLEQVRRIPAPLLMEPGVVIYQDERGNVIFPHYDVYPFGRISGGDPCGFEIKNQGFTGFAPGGMKGLWVMFRWCVNAALVICESSIDCLSYVTLFPNVACLLASVSGQLSEAQGEMITSLVAETFRDLEAASEHVGQPVSEASLEVIVATDSDAAGIRLADLVLTAAECAGCSGVKCYHHVPQGYKDWNEQLMAEGKRRFNDV